MSWYLISFFSYNTGRAFQSYLNCLRTTKRLLNLWVQQNYRGLSTQESDTFKVLFNWKRGGGEEELEGWIFRMYSKLWLISSELRHSSQAFFGFYRIPILQFWASFWHIEAFKCGGSVYLLIVNSWLSDIFNFSVTAIFIPIMGLRLNVLLEKLRKYDKAQVKSFFIKKIKTVSIVYGSDSY